MNSFKYNFADMESLGVFAGFRGHSERWPEVLTPGLYRAHNHPSKDKYIDWMKRSRIASNMLKQRFLEHENKPLTDLEAAGILQHHFVIGSTDMVDLSFDINVAKWFSLNQFVRGAYRRKVFHEIANARKAAREASCVYTIAVRPIGSIQLDGEPAKFFTPGVTFNWWEGLAPLVSGLPKAEVPPYNLAPLWSEYPQRQKGFGLRGIFPGEHDKFGSVLVVTEHLFHPIFYKNGWDRIGGPEATLDGQLFSYDTDSSWAAHYLFPTRPDWFKDVVSEVKRVVKELA